MTPQCTNNVKFDPLDRLIDYVLNEAQFCAIMTPIGEVMTHLLIGYTKVTSRGYLRFFFPLILDD